MAVFEETLAPYVDRLTPRLRALLMGDYRPWQPAVAALVEARQDRPYRTLEGDMEGLQSVLPLLAIRPDAVTAADAESLRARLSATDLKPHSVNLKLRAVRQTFTAYCATRPELANPFAAVRRLQEIDPEVWYLEDGEQVRLLRGFDRRSWNGFRDFCMTMVVLDTGLGLRDLLDLEVDDLDPPDDRTGEASLHVRGTGHTVPVSRQVADALREYLRRRRDEIAPVTVKFWVTTVGQPCTPAAYSKALQRAGKKAKIADCSVRLLRLTFCRNMFVKGGAAPAQLAQLLGHWDGKFRAAQRLHQAFSPDNPRARDDVA